MLSPTHRIYMRICIRDISTFIPGCHWCCLAEWILAFWWGWEEPEIQDVHDLDLPQLCLLEPDGNPETWTPRDQPQSCECLGTQDLSLCFLLSCPFYCIRPRLWISWAFPCIPTWTRIPTYTGCLTKPEAGGCALWMAPDELCALGNFSRESRDVR